MAGSRATPERGLFFNKGGGHNSSHVAVVTKYNCDAMKGFKTGNLEPKMEEKED